MIFLAYFKNPSLTKWIAVFIYPSTCGTCILKHFFIMIRTDLGLTGCYGYVIFQQVYHWFQPAGCYFHIRIQDNEIVGLYLLQCFIISFCKTPVL